MRQRQITQRLYFLWWHQGWRNVEPIRRQTWRGFSQPGLPEKIPSRGWIHIPPNRKFGKSSTQNPIFGGYVSSLEGNHGVPKKKRIKIAKGPTKIGFDESVKVLLLNNTKKKMGPLGVFKLGVEKTFSEKKVGEASQLVAGLRGCQGCCGLKTVRPWK